MNYLIGGIFVMGWLIGAIIFGIIQFVWIVAILAAVFRRKQNVWSKSSVMGYAIHGVTAVLFIWMLLMAVAWKIG